MSHFSSSGSTPLTVAEALRRIAAEESERRRLEAPGSAQDDLDRFVAEPVHNPLHEFQQDRAKVLV